MSNQYNAYAYYKTNDTKVENGMVTEKFGRKVDFLKSQFTPKNSNFVHHKIILLELLHSTVHFATLLLFAFQ